MNISPRRLAAPIFSFCVLLALIVPARAATYTVSKVADTADGTCNADCSLREAVTAANSAAGDDAIVFGTPAFDTRQTITLGGAQLPIITTNISISGPEAGVILNGNGQSRVLEIGTNANVTLAKLTVTGGNSGNGGGIYSAGNLTLDSCTLSGNRATYGGGVCSITNSSGKTLTLQNSTVSDNRSTEDGGGVFVRDGHAVIESSTIFNNVALEADETSIRVSGGIYAEQFSAITRVEVHNSIIAGNVSGDVTAYRTQVSVIYVSQGYNLLGSVYFSDTNPFNAAGDRSNFSASAVKLGALQENGGAAFTRLPASDSPAVNAGDTSLTVDQRGVSRPFGTQDDIGAVEYSPTQPGPNFVVNVLGDGDDGSCSTGNCSLREAVNAANGNANGSDITFSPTVFASRQEITLSKRALSGRLRA